MSSIPSWTEANVDPKSGQAGTTLACVHLCLSLSYPCYPDMSSLCLLAIFFFISTVIANPTFKLTDVFRGSDFFDRFRWETFDDPTHGRVNCIDKNTAEANNLSCTSSHNSKFIMRANANTVVPPDARGRDSVRITSQTSYS